MNEGIAYLLIITPKINFVPFQYHTECYLVKQ